MIMFYTYFGEHGVDFGCTRDLEKKQTVKTAHDRTAVVFETLRSRLMTEYDKSYDDATLLYRNITRVAYV